MSPHMKHDPLPPATPALAKRAWNAQFRPSARRVARALKQAGYRAHYTTIARWRSKGWEAVEGEHPLDAARANLDAALPVLSGDPTTTTEELVERSDDKLKHQVPPDAELLRTAARHAMLIQILVCQELQGQVAKLVRTRPMEVGILIGALADSIEASNQALLQALAPKIPKEK